MKTSYLFFVVLALVLLPNPGFAINNANSCSEIRGFCVMYTCPPGFDKVGNCDKNFQCCKSQGRGVDKVRSE
ncbi:UNVERIFIED_CONTAM: hypothetical protein K2H54_036479 [Gekko kuhli]